MWGKIPNKSFCGKNQDEFKRKFSVDHNHSTGEVRGLLCNSCNKAIGHAFDDISILQNSISYLNKYSEGESNPCQ